MADLKISQLTGATTPLAGTEVVPLVQSSTTKKVSVANLTEGRSVGAAKVNIGTSSEFGLLNVSSSGANDAIATLGDFTTPGNSVGIYGRVNGSGVFSIKTAGVAIRLSSDVGLANPVDILNGNIIPGTAAKGVNFTANTPAAGMTSQLLNWYEEGTWTPTDASGAGLSLTVSDNKYTRVGRLVQVNALITFPATASGLNVTIGGFPFVCGNYSSGPMIVFGAAGGYVTMSATLSTVFGRDSSGNTITNSVLSGKTISISIAYMV